MHDWVLVYSSNSLIDAEMMKAKLADHDINVVQLNKKDSSYLSFGEIELYCQPDHVLKALSLIRGDNDAAESKDF